MRTPRCWTPGRCADSSRGSPAREVFLCGTPGLAAAVQAALAQAGLPARQLHEQRFAF